ncbi:MAG: hypothetical protein WBB74_08585 [Gaiellaceae bacterium]
MRARLTKLMAAFTVVGALAVGGATLASAGSKASPVQPSASAVDVQQGDQSAPDGLAGEQSSESETTGLAGESSSEAAPSDGPGGYADANAGADTQFQGEQ